MTISKVQNLTAINQIPLQPQHNIQNNKNPEGKTTNQNQKNPTLPYKKISDIK